MCVCVWGGGGGDGRLFIYKRLGWLTLDIVAYLSSKQPLSHLVAMIFECILGKSDTYFLCIVRQ